MHKIEESDKFIVRGRDKIKKDKWAKLYVKLKPSKRNMYRQQLIITLKLKQINM